MTIFKKENINLYINYLIIAYAFCIPLSRAGISILSCLLILLWIYEGDFKNKIDFIKKSMFLKVLSLFIIVSYISVFWGNIIYFIEGLDYVTKYVRLLFLPILVIATSLRKEFVSKVISAFLIAMLISEFLSFGIFFEFWSINGKGPSDPTPFMHRLDYAYFLVFTSLLLLNRTFSIENLKLKVVYFTYFAVVTSNLFVNGGRIGHYTFLISIFVVVFLNIKNKLKAFLSVILLVLAIFYSAYEFSPVFKTRYNTTINEYNEIVNESSFCSSIGRRLGSWIIASEIIVNNPIIGTGTGSEMSYMREYINENYPNKKCILTLSNYHNDFIQTAVRLGFLGIVLYLLLFYSILKINIKDTGFSNLKVIFISVTFIAAMVESILHNQFSMSLMALFLGVFYLWKRKIKWIKINH